MTMEQEHRPELLAPAGSIESFFAAVRNGADAIYAGLRSHNARALATNFTLDEIARLREYAHGQNVKLYVALNALVREDELRELVRLLAGLAQTQPDGLIIQDAAIASLCRSHFPDLALHASTLMTVHNSAGVEQLENMGFQRAVLARELSIDELEQIAAETSLPLEIFVHGSLCFSYSGLCLASSFYGGRSSLRGRCTQPCRRLYRSGRDQGYLFSTNDLSAIELIPRLRRLRIAAFKIEGRMKPASYVAAVVRAYRVVLDAPPGQEAEAANEALLLLREALGRKPTRGFLVPDQHKEIITPHRSGASGRMAARVEWVRGDRMALRTLLPLSVGDRVRLDSDEAVQKSAFTLRGIKVDGRGRSEVPTGTLVTVPRTVGARRGDRLFKTGSKSAARTSAAKLRRILREKTTTPPPVKSNPALTRAIQRKRETRRSDRKPNTFCLLLSHHHLLNAALDSGATWVALQATRSNLHSVSRPKLPPARRDRFIWALPAIIQQQDLTFYRKQVRILQERGYNRWLVANWGHYRLFSSPPQMLVADHTFNVLNSQAGSLLQQLGCEYVILSLENDRRNLARILQSLPQSTPLVPIYGRPSLFTSRLEVRVRQRGSIKGPGKDSLRQKRQDRFTEVRPELPFCLFEHLQDLRKLGAVGFVVDLRGQNLQPEGLHAIMKNLRRRRCPQAHTSFNYLGQLV
ncbi:MAG: U32 family peptidase [Deltaproteobacteria bacterium]|nr:MAG: U32 family peptidase [Deltaproteobacteria bacterium]